VSRELVLNRVRSATREPDRRDRPAAPAWTRPWPTSSESAEELISRFTVAAQALKAHVHRCPLEEAGSLIAGVAGEHGCARATLSAEEVVARSGAESALRIAGIATAVNPGRDWQLAADLGVTGVDLAFAATATLVLASTEERPRATSLLPWVHVALVLPEQILDGLHSWDCGLAGGPGAGSGAATMGASAWTLVTGPSRTSDIERILTLGAHGPGVLHVVITSAA